MSKLLIAILPLFFLLLTLVHTHDDPLFPLALNESEHEEVATSSIPLTSDGTNMDIGASVIHDIQMVVPLAANPHNIQMVLTWDPTYCRKETCKDRYERFRLHGLWPADNRGNTLPGRNPGPTIIPQLSAALQRRLRSTWPSNRIGQSNEQMWDNEWYRHGVVSRLGVQAYFQAADTQFTKIRELNLLRELRNHNIVPADRRTYKRSKILADLRTIIGYDVYISCYGSRNMLFEIYVCLNVRANAYINCPASTYRRGCGSGDPNIEFPRLAP